VTGATAGIGLEIARVLARRGYDVALVARRQDRLERLARELEESHGVTAAVLPCDLADRSARERLCAHVAERRVGVDMLVNNAGFGLRGAFATTDLGVEQRMVEVNVTALVALTKAILPAMVERKSGCVLNVASTAAFVPGPLVSVYYASKAFVLSFSEALAEELRDSGVHVAALCPGPTTTEFQAVAGMRPSRLGRLAMMTAAEVAEIGVDGALARRRVVVPGLQNKVVPWAVRALPRRVAAWLSRRAAEVG
jgi:hypothetical protein